MSFIDSMSSIATNLGLSRLAPANADAIKDSIHNLSKHSKSAGVYRKANQQGRVLSDKEFHEKAQDSVEKALELEGGKNVKKTLLARDEAQTRMQVSKNHQVALGREGEALKQRDGSVLDKEGLKEFRRMNNSQIKEHTKGSQKARKELAGHAKDYFFSGDLGTNAMRWGAAGAVYGAANVGVRTLSGGSATTNNQGQRDIAGIPFI